MSSSASKPEEDAEEEGEEETEEESLRQQQILAQFERAVAQLSVDELSVATASGAPTDPRVKELGELLEKQRAEQSRVAQRPCLFCKETFNGTISVLQEHMFSVHNFSVGLAANLVHSEELFQLIAQKLAANTCLYCERVFKSLATLRQHMRKKKHLRINSRNKTYDKYYLINYLEPGKPWQVVSQESSSEDEVSSHSSDRLSRKEEDGEEDEEWADWAEVVEEPARCLFCPLEAATPAGCLDHMKTSHGGFDLAGLVDGWGLEIYDRIKLVNFIRHAVERWICIGCNSTFTSCDDLTAHMTKESHYKPQKVEAMFSSQFLIPVQNPDGLLTHFVNNDS